VGAWLSASGIGPIVNVVARLEQGRHHRAPLGDVAKSPSTTKIDKSPSTTKINEKQEEA
jgi:hypothetical protein